MHAADRLLVALGVVGVGLAVLTRAGDVRAETLSPLMKRVTVEGRGYLVARLLGGVYSVVSVVTPTVGVTLDQTHEISATGNPRELEQLRADMRRFPSDLFR